MKPRKPKGINVPVESRSHQSNGKTPETGQSPAWSSAQRRGPVTVAAAQAPRYRAGAGAPKRVEF